jgi:hypothetical protein
MQRFIKYLPGVFFGLNLALFALLAHAQESDRVNARIPFDFVVGDKQLKAGNYVIESFLDHQALRFRSKNGEVQQLAFTVPVETNKIGNHERLIFHRDSDTYFLSQVWLSGDQDGRNLIPGAQEKSLEKSQPAVDQAIIGQ